MKLFVTLALIVGVSACASVQPDLARLYSFNQQSSGQPPVILIHGAFGSRLQDSDGVEKWPGSLNRILLDDYRDLAFQIDPATLQPITGPLMVNGMTDRIAGQDYYGRIREVLEAVGGYQLQAAGTPPAVPGRYYYSFEYDWRQDNVISAAQLHRYLNQIREDLGDPELRFDIVAHSMGGLVARYFARYGSTDVLEDNEFPVSATGAGYLRRVVLLGTPNLGSITSVKNMIDGMKVGFGRIQPEVLATFPSAYQLLPHPLNEWLYTSAGEPLERDLFDISIWQQFDLAIFDQDTEDRIRADYPSVAEADAAVATRQAFFHKSIERGRRFVWSLTVPAQELSIDYILFGGDCHLTPNRLIVEEVAGESVVHLEPGDIVNPIAGIDYQRLMLEPGDGTVTKASLLARQDTDPSIGRHPYSYFPLKYSVFLCENHTKLTGNINFQDNLMHVLLSQDRI